MCLDDNMKDSKKMMLARAAFDKLVEFLKSIQHQYTQLANSGAKRINAATDTGTRATIARQLIEISRQFIRDFNAIVPMFRSERRPLKYFFDEAGKEHVKTVVDIIKTSHDTWSELFGAIVESMSEDKQADPQLIRNIVDAEHSIELDAEQYLEIFTTMNFTVLTMPFCLSNAPNTSDVVLPAVYVVKIVKGALTYVAFRLCIQSVQNQGSSNMLSVVIRFMGLLVVLDALVCILAVSVEEATGFTSSIGVTSLLTTDVILSDAVLLFITWGTVMTLQRRTFFQASQNPSKAFNTLQSAVTYIIIANSFIPYFLLY